MGGVDNERRATTEVVFGECHSPRSLKEKRDGRKLVGRNPEYTYDDYNVGFTHRGHAPFLFHIFERPVRRKMNSEWYQIYREVGQMSGVSIIHHGRRRTSPLPAAQPRGPSEESRFRL